MSETTRLDARLDELRYWNKRRHLSEDETDELFARIADLSKRLAEQQAWMDKNEATMEAQDKAIQASERRLVEVEAALTHASIEVIDWQSAAGKAEERLEEVEAALRLLASCMPDEIYIYRGFDGDVCWDTVEPEDYESQLFNFEKVLESVKSDPQNNS